MHQRVRSAWSTIECYIPGCHGILHLIQGSTIPFHLAQNVSNVCSRDVLGWSLEYDVTIFSPPFGQM